MGAFPHLDSTCPITVFYTVHLQIFLFTYLFTERPTNVIFFKTEFMCLLTRLPQCMCVLSGLGPCLPTWVIPAQFGGTHLISHSHKAVVAQTLTLRQPPPHNVGLCSPSFRNVHIFHHEQTPGSHVYSAMDT